MKCRQCDKQFEPGMIVYDKDGQPFCVDCGNIILESLSESISQAELEVTSLKNKFLNMTASQRNYQHPRNYSVNVKV